MGGSLGSPKMMHLAHLIVSTKAQVIFLSETRNSRITNVAIINHFNVDDACIVPAQGLSGGLCLLWNQDVGIDVVTTSQNFIFALCVHKQPTKKFGLVFMYGDPHH